MDKSAIDIAKALVRLRNSILSTPSARLARPIS
jgi:hypothetical protein